jgi:uracil-DNA glycosylase
VLARAETSENADYLPDKIGAGPIDVVDTLGIFLAAMITVSQLLDKAFACRLCPKSYGFSSRTADEPFFKFPPIIGKTHDANLLFVGINPRISNSNRSDHDFWMRDKPNFRSLSENKLRGQFYIEQEPHYRFHIRLVKILFGEYCKFENVAAVTEIFLCATKDSNGLPSPESPCADIYFGDTVGLTNPKVIVAVGGRVMEYFNILPNNKWIQNQMVLKFDGRAIPVDSIPHPADRSLSESQKHVRVLETATHRRQHLAKC